MNNEHQLLLSFYGDDFTGSTDSMEALAFNGVKTVLFLEPPSLELLQSKFSDARAIGLAGVSRAMSREQMNKDLKPLLEQLAQLPTTILHYKICSTFDSSPEAGSIGCVIDMAAGLTASNRQAGSYIPLLVGAPSLKRYTLFGHHFATVDQVTYRLDRHPTMSRHPITPMDEADLRNHLAKQTSKSIVSMDIVDLAGTAEQIKSRLISRLENKADIVLFDVLDDERLQAAGRLIWEGALEEGNRFVVGSSGVEYGLVKHWQAEGLIDRKYEPVRSMQRAEPLLVVSGSCSPVTEQQIHYALKHGFEAIPIDPERFIIPEEAEAARQEWLEQALKIIEAGRSPLLYTALGPEDDCIGRIRQRLAEMGRPASHSSHLLGEQLGLLTKEIIENSGVRRFVIAGGDTSGYVTRQLGIYAMEAVMPIAPGGPLCKGYSNDEVFNHIEFVLKGGQVGKEDFFVRVREGK